MIAKRLLLLFLVLFVSSCGPKKRTVYKKPTTKPKEIIVQPKEVEKKDTEVLESTSKTKVYTDVVSGYIDEYKDIAKSQMGEYGIPASIILAQGILESGAGRGDLVKKANNHFGIKCHNWNGEGVTHDDDTRGECFRKYSHPSESYKDHSLFLSGRSRYGFLFELKKNDYKGWAKGLRKAGYATDPKYPQKLIGLIERYQLYMYDAEVLGNDYVVEVTNTESPSITEKYTVVKGDTLYSISRRFQLTVDQLKQLNSLSDNYIHEGQELFVKPLQSDY